MIEVWDVMQGAAGTALIGLVLSDVFRSVVLPHTTASTLRLGPLLGRWALAGALAWAGRRPAARRHTVLVALGPLLVVAELVVWVAALVVGFALLLDALDTGMRPPPSFGDALYAAGSAFFTLGLSMQEASSGGARFVVVVASFSGFGVVTLVVTYLLSLQVALRARETLVLRLRERAGHPPSGVALLEVHARLGHENDGALLDFFREWEEWSAGVLLTHRASPILAYFRSTDEDCEWLTALGAVLDAAALVAALGEGTAETSGAAEHATLCHRMGTRLVSDVARRFGPPPPAGPCLDEAAFRAAEGRLRAAGYAIGRSDADAWSRFAELRARHAPALLALCRYFAVRPAAW